MFAINDHVTRKGTTNPVGLIADIKAQGWVTVRWGVQDGHIFREAIHEDYLQLVEHHIESPDEVLRNQAKASGLPYREVKEVNS